MLFVYFNQFETLVENVFKTKITYFQSDGGKDHDSGLFCDFLIKQGIYVCKLIPTHNNRVC